VCCGRENRPQSIFVGGPRADFEANPKCNTESDADRVASPNVRPNGPCNPLPRGDSRATFGAISRGHFRGYSQGWLRITPVVASHFQPISGGALTQGQRRVAEGITKGKGVLKIGDRVVFGLVHHPRIHHGKNDVPKVFTVGDPPPLKHGPREHAVLLKRKVTHAFAQRAAGDVSAGLVGVFGVVVFDHLAVLSADGKVKPALDENKRIQWVTGGLNSSG